MLAVLKRSLVLGTTLSLLAAPTLASNCHTNFVHWDYWWYGAGNNYECASGECFVGGHTSKTISWAVTQGGSGLGFNDARSLAQEFNSGYTWEKDVANDINVGKMVQGPTTVRSWIKQWFAVVDLNCGSNHYLAWVPCSNGDCREYQISDAYAQCDSSNHCQQN